MWYWVETFCWLGSADGPPLDSFGFGLVCTAVFDGPACVVVFFVRVVYIPSGDCIAIVLLMFTDNLSPNNSKLIYLQ